MYDLLKEMKNDHTHLLMFLQTAMTNQAHKGRIATP